MSWMGFFKKIRSSVYDPDFYSKIGKLSLASVLRFFFLFILFLTIINTLILAYPLGVQVPQEIKNFIDKSVASYPADLVVEINDGKVATTGQEPFFVPFERPDVDAEYLEQYGDINNVLVIDTKTPYSASQFDQYKTLFWLTQDSLFYRGDNFDQRSIPLNEVEDVKIDKGFVQDLTNKASPWLNLVGPGLILLMFIGFFLGFTLNLLYFLFLGVLIYFLSSILKWGLNYSTAYKTAVFASVLSFIVDFVLLHTGVYSGFFGFPFFFTLTALCIATINLQNFEQKS